MKHFYSKVLLTALTLTAGSLSLSARQANFNEFDLTKLRYQIDSKSVFSNKQTRNIADINRLVEHKSGIMKAAAVENPEPEITFAPANQTGNIDAPNGELWYYTGNFVYEEIPPHDNVYFTDRILQSWSFDIYNAQMELIGTINDKMDYAPNEVRVPMCEIAPVATRNFFNTDDKIEIIIALAVNRDGGGNNYRSLVYSLGGEKDADGDDVPVYTLDDIIGDVIEGPASPDGSDNFYISLMRDVYEPAAGEPVGDDNNSFWPYLLAQKVSIEVYGKATADSNGPRLLHKTIIPLIQLPGDQENIGPMMSMLRGDDVVYMISYYKEPFYNRYDDPMSEDMTQREGNSLIVELYQATENDFTKFSTTEIPVVHDPMNNSAGEATCLFSYFSVGSLRYTGDVLFDAPGASATAPDFIVTRGNYQISTDGITDSYFTYKNDGTLKNTLATYADGTLAMGNLPGFEPQQLFVSQDSYGYLYNFVDLYSGKTVVQIPADYYYDDDSDSELLMANVARYLDGNSYKYVFELRYPLVDDNENDILRFMHINSKGEYDHIDYLNMGTNVAYAQSYLSTEAMAPHAYSTSDVPTYMFLVKRGVAGSVMVEELMIVEAETDENPDGKVLLKIGDSDNGVLASIVPEFATENQPGRLFVYYIDNVTDKYALDIYALPIGESSGVSEITAAAPGLAIENGIVTAEGHITVYAIDGRIAATAIGTLDTAILNRGAYIITAGGKTCKFIKK
ncbi:MAG: hypothetical protein K2N28_04435 [Muribaculaceae bacterium]|nr:hypothetical protein [Muribaculaceae bacterium]